MRMTQAEYAAYMAAQERRKRAQDRLDSVSILDDRSESRLHEQIVEWCRVNRAACAHGSMSARTHRTLGEPDFWICWKGRVVPIECKTAAGKLSTAQRDFQFLCGMNGVDVQVVRSFDEFLSAVEPKKAE